MPTALQLLAAEVSACRRCPRLLAWRECVAAERRAAFRDQTYWGRPVPGFGDPAARLVLLGLAPAAHGANRTGRVFTGDRSGDFLFAAMWRSGLASQPTSSGPDDGLRLHGAWVTAAVRCAPPANRPSAAERERCLPFTERELSLLPDARTILCLGGFAWDAALRLRAWRGESGSGGGRSAAKPRFGDGGGRRAAKPRFGHGEVAQGERLTLIGCYHPSQQNTFTGRLTEQMMDAVLERACELAGLPGPGATPAGSAD